jgi:hypothetical protein
VSGLDHRSKPLFLLQSSGVMVSKSEARRLPYSTAGEGAIFVHIGMGDSAALGRRQTPVDEAASESG